MTRTHPKTDNELLQAIYNELVEFNSTISNMQRSLRQIEQEVSEIKLEITIKGDPFENTP